MAILNMIIFLTKISEFPEHIFSIKKWNVAAANCLVEMIFHDSLELGAELIPAPS